MTQRRNFEICDSVASALRDLKSGSSIMAGGFGLAGIPETMIEWTRTQDHITDLEIISTEAGDDDWGLGRLYTKDKIRVQHASYIGRCKAMEHAYLTGRTTLHLIPQGTFAEKIRCAAAGIPAFYTRTGLHTLYAAGRLPTRHSPDGEPIAFNRAPETRTFASDGREYLLEEAFPEADFAWIKAHQADTLGNCVFRGTAQNYNRIMAGAARTTVVEADEIVPAGTLAPEAIHLPGLYVDRVFRGTNAHRIEAMHLSSPSPSPSSSASPPSPSDTLRDTIARRAARELPRGSTVNLGVGLPTLTASHAPGVWIQTENGILGAGGYPATAAAADASYINAGKEPIVPLAGASVFGSDDAFAQIRGGHLDVTVLGALQVSRRGDLANYAVPGKMVRGMGGAMDLVANPERTRVVVVQTHTDKRGGPKIVDECDLPVTGRRCVHTIVTELACFDVDFDRGGLVLRDYNPDTTVEEIRKKTGCGFVVGEGCKPWEI